MVLRQAVKWRLIPRNPLEDASVPPAPEPKVPAHWREEEAAAFFAHDPEHEDWPLWVVLALCQLRIGEALVLRWGDVDLDRGVLRVERGLSVAKDGGKIETSPKSPSSRRSVTVPPEALAALRLQRERQDGRRRLLGSQWRGEVPGYVFDDGYGGRQGGQMARKRFDRAQRAAGVPRITCHSLRHTGATALARAGMPVRVLQDRRGHASPVITQMVYSHHLVQDQAPHADAFASRIIGNPSGVKRGTG
jgi:integrase